MKLPYPLLMSLVLVIGFSQGTTYGASPTPPAISPEFTRAEEQLRSDMLKADKRLQKIVHKLGHFPNYGPEMEHTMVRINQTISSNPFQKLAQDKSLQDWGRVTLSIDHSLSPKTIERIREKAAPHWQANPGTITMVSNGKDLVLIWGADITGKPLCDPKTTNIYLLESKLN